MVNDILYHSKVLSICINKNFRFRSPLRGGTARGRFLEIIVEKFYGSSISETPVCYRMNSLSRARKSVRDFSKQEEGFYEFLENFSCKQKNSSQRCTRSFGS